MRLIIKTRDKDREDQGRKGALVKPDLDVYLEDVETGVRMDATMLFGVDLHVSVDNVVKADICFYPSALDIDVDVELQNFNVLADFGKSILDGCDDF